MTHHSCIRRGCAIISSEGCEACAEDLADAQRGESADDAIDAIRALLAALDESRREVERLRGEVNVRVTLLMDAVADARRAALEEAIADCESVEAVGLSEGASYCAARLRALIDRPPDT